MKFITNKLAFLIVIILTSCGSDQLSKSEAESIIKECQEKSDKAIFKTNIFYYGIIDIPDSSNANFQDIMDKHRKLEELGLVNIGEAEKDTREFGNSKGEIIEVSLTPKGKEFIVGRVDDTFGRLYAQFRSCEYKIKEIREIQEIPESNEAKVKVAFERYNETPFFEEANEKNNPKEIIEIAPFRKTTDGWKLCE